MIVREGKELHIVYHKTFQIVDYTMTNIQKIRFAKIVYIVPPSQLFVFYGFVTHINRNIRAKKLRFHDHIDSTVKSNQLSEHPHSRIIIPKLSIQELIF